MNDALRPLLAAAAEGDDRALAELVRQSQPAVWRVCELLGSPGEADDLAQEVYLRALRNLGSYRGEGPVLVWLLSIARHTCADHVRRRQRQRSLMERLRVTATEVVPGQPESVDDLLRGLSDERREAFVLTQLIGLSYAEAAAALECPIGTIRSRVARARADLLAIVRRAEAV